MMMVAGAGFFAGTRVDEEDVMIQAAMAVGAVFMFLAVYYIPALEERADEIRKAAEGQTEVDDALCKKANKLQADLKDIDFVFGILAPSKSGSHETEGQELVDLACTVAETPDAETPDAETPDAETPGTEISSPFDLPEAFKSHQHAGYPVNSGSLDLLQNVHWKEGGAVKNVAECRLKTEGAGGKLFSIRTNKFLDIPNSCLMFTDKFPSKGYEAGFDWSLKDQLYTQCVDDTKDPKKLCK